MEDHDTEESIQARISKPMTDLDLEQYTGVKPEDIIKYSQLKNYASITDLLPKDKSFRIILIEDKYNSGHFVAILRYGDTIEFWNSYAGKPDDDWKFINRMIRAILGENSNELTRLFKNAEDLGFKTTHNTTRVQKLSNNIQTCGRWCVLRIELMKAGYNLPQFITFVKQYAKKLGKSTDYIASKMVWK
jgi:hypothetical protein